MLTPTIYQQKILETVGNNILVQACAGAGKTATLRMICSQEKNSNVIAVCFNKSIQLEFEKKLPFGVTAKTLHSVGLAECRRNGKVTITKGKIYKSIDKLFPDERNLRGFLPRLVSLMIGTMRNDIGQLCKDYALDIDPKYYNHAMVLRDHMRTDRTTLSFDDMLDFPVYYGYDIMRYDIVLVDEAQDLNALQIAFIKKLIKPTGSLVAVGDRKQSIYMFRGASCSAMDDVKTEFNCVELTLPTCFRCAKAIVIEAQKVVGAEIIQPWNDCAGVVISRPAIALAQSLNDLSDGDLVVCRVNALLVRPCLSLIKRGVKAVIRGAEIGQEIIDIVDMIKENDLNRFLARLEIWRNEKVEKAEKRERHTLVAYYDDLYDTILAFATVSVSQLKRDIKSVFSDEITGIVFSTIHKAKGLEADTVMFLAPELVPHPMSVKHGNAETLKQEDNLKYVAITRAKKKLIYQEGAK